MKDFLEEEVDEKYYIHTEKADKLIKDLLAETNIETINGGGEQSITFTARNFANDNPNYPTQYEKTDVAATVLARDWKGPANFVRMNGVMEYEHTGSSK